MLIYRAGRFFKLVLNPQSYWRAFRDLARLRYPVVDDAPHLTGAIDWILRAQQATGGGGVAAWYCLGEGWHAPYPETTGYIIPTCLDFAARFGRDDARAAALNMGEWTLTTQLESGGVRGGTDPKANPVVFNTGQCMLGWHRLVAETSDPRYREALRKAAQWLVLNQDADGKWVRNEYRGEPHAYHTRVAWPLFLAGQLLNSGEFHAAGVRSIEWCLSNVGERGWLRRMGFAERDPILTHTIAYTYEGLLECIAFLDEPVRQMALDVVTSAAENLLHLYERRKTSPYGVPRFMPGTLDPSWRGTSGYSCVTGDAQIAVFWLKLFQINKDWRLVNASLKMLDQVKSCQDLKASNPGIRGGIPSSMPLYGGYLPMRYLNWAAKFYADALMLLMDAMRDAEAGCS